VLAQGRPVAPYDGFAGWDVERGWVVAARRGAVFSVWRLHGDTVESSAEYRGGAASLPRLGAAPGPVLVVSRVRTEGAALFRLDLGEERLPSTLVPIVGAGHRTHPSLLRTGPARLLAYVSGAPGQGSFEIVPLDAAWRARTEPLVIAPRDAAVVDAHALRLAEGRLLAVYLANPDGKPRLVSAQLTCD
jgi:hypothetical protein